jgi:hypothetical protein
MFTKFVNLQFNKSAAWCGAIKWKRGGRDEYIEPKRGSERVGRDSQL